ncbi:hypothetical protein A3759_25510 [Thalassolituus sp. HI0120]|nr:hypothetical protein A3759_15895 [Thalassolituus sp. HI0120]KZZ50238.1 hypothetical protein A3759_25510 [Thalassolituus sp. HI0120]
MINNSLYSEEELGLLNPAYTGFILYSSISEFVAFKPSGMHCALPFVAIPMSMNKSISQKLPGTYKTPIGSWVTSNEGVLASLYEQAESYNPIVKSAINFLLDKGIISITGNGTFLIENYNLVKSPALFKKSNDMKEALRASKFIGKWFSHAPSVETIYAQLGIRP